MNPTRFAHWVPIVAMMSLSSPFTTSFASEPLSLQLRFQTPIAKQSDGFHLETSVVDWRPEESAILICDVWDYHHCLNAVRRLDEMTPRLNEVVVKARELGMTIIHCPSDCMPTYDGTPARERAKNAPRSPGLPADSDIWNCLAESESGATYPIDQSDGGEDDDAVEHAEWAKHLESLGRNPKMPWKAQNPKILIDQTRDYITDRGAEVLQILEQRGVKNVILAGVHANMCVLGRPFGLRQMKAAGKNVVLMRDMTDTMYNPARWPYVSHFTANDLIVEYVERYVCPTMASSQILGGTEFRFSHDQRPRVVILVAENEYSTRQSLQSLAHEQLGREFSVRFVYERESRQGEMPGIETLSDADALLVSVRRRPLLPETLDTVKRFVARGRPVLGIRTASHAFSLREEGPPQGLQVWPEFDKDVFGGSYSGHGDNDANAEIRAPSPDASGLLARAEWTTIHQTGSLYRTAPVHPKARILLLGREHSGFEAPVAWTYERSDGGKSFYTSLGTKGDFSQPPFRNLLVHALGWLTGVEISKNHTDLRSREWEVVSFKEGFSQKSDTSIWLRKAVHMTKLPQEPLILSVESENLEVTPYVNGTPLAVSSPSKNHFTVPKDLAPRGETLFLSIHATSGKSDGRILAIRLQDGSATSDLRGNWQMRQGGDATWSNLPLPAKFGAPAEIVHVYR